MPLKRHGLTEIVSRKYEMASTKNTRCVKKNGIWVAKDGAYESVKIQGLVQAGNLFYVAEQRYAVWSCWCGEFFVSNYQNVARGKVKSCGCYRREIAKMLNQKATRKLRKASTSQISLVDFESTVSVGLQIEGREVIGVPFRLKFNGRSHNHAVCLCVKCGRFDVCSTSDIQDAKQCRECYLSEHTTHGRTGQRLFKIWQKMID
jgi:hypothetical protein